MVTVMMNVQLEVSHPYKYAATFYIRKTSHNPYKGFICKLNVF